MLRGLTISIEILFEGSCLTVFNTVALATYITAYHMANNIREVLIFTNFAGKGNFINLTISKIITIALPIIDTTVSYTYCLYRNSYLKQ